MGASKKIKSYHLPRLLAVAGMSQEEFGELFNVGRVQVSRWLNNKSPVPGYVERWVEDNYPGFMNEDVS